MYSCLTPVAKNSNGVSTGSHLSEQKFKALDVKTPGLGVPIVARWVKDPALLKLWRGSQLWLRSWRCCDCGVGRQLQFRFDP